MKYSRTIRRTVSQGGIGAALCCALLAASRAARYPATATSRRRELRRSTAQVLQQVGVTQRLNQMLPLDARFVDDTGKNVRLGDYFGKRPPSSRWSTTTARCSARRRWTALPARWRWYG